jgi:hypothetical protein
MFPFLSIKLFKMKTKQSIYFFLVIALILCFSSKASNKVTIASIGSEKPYFGKNQDPQEMVNKMIEFWRGQIKAVLSHNPDLIVLTEACDRPSGLSVDEQFDYFKVRKKQIWDYFSSVAKANNCYIAFGTKWEEEAGIWRNSCVVLDREGETAGIYNKNFPTIGEMEAGIKASNEAPIIQCDFGRLACAICFDLNFDELRQQYEKEKPDIIVFPSMYHGGLVQSNWAYSCRSFFVSSCGFNDLPSEIRNPLGEVIASSTNYFHYVVATVNLDSHLVHLDENWGKLRAIKEKYGKAVTITDPGKLGAVLVTSEHDKINVLQMIKEFDIELLDDYFARSREFRIEQIGQGF